MGNDLTGLVKAYWEYCSAIKSVGCLRQGSWTSLDGGAILNFT